MSARQRQNTQHTYHKVGMALALVWALFSVITGIIGTWLYLKIGSVQHAIDLGCVLFGIGFTGIIIICVHAYLRESAPTEP